MCLSVYIASDRKLPLVSETNQSFGFYLRELEGFENTVRQHFSKPHIYYLGSAEGCGCGFLFDVGYPYMPEYKLARKSYRLVSKYLQKELNNESIEIYSRWAGDEAKIPIKRVTATPIDVSKREFEFGEGVLITITAE